MSIGERPAAMPGIWRFGAVVLDERRASLRVDGVAVELDRSSHDVLLALLRHAGEVVTKEELLEAGWPGRVVSENSLAKAVGRLRQALGTQGAGIRAVHGYGYRLAAAVEFKPDARQPLPVANALPGEGETVAARPGWRLRRRLGRGGHGATFLAGTSDGGERVLKFACGEAGLRGLKREIGLARYIEAVQPGLPGVARVLGWNLEQPPFFLELPFFADGHLADWAARGGLDALDRDERVALCARLCETVAGLHAIGIVHKDLKPENLYPQHDDEGRWQLVLADLGAGQAAATPRLLELGITLSMGAGEAGDRAGSLLYLAPEVVGGSVATQRSDVYAVGVLVYQLLAGDLRRPLAPGWETDVGDALLVEDIALAAAANPERRLASAAEFAARLRDLASRHEQQALQSEAARQQAAARALLERQRARRPWRLATAAVLAIGVAASAVFALRATEAERQAREQAAVAAAVNRFFNEDVLAAASPYALGTRGEPTLREALDFAVRRIDQRLGEQPLVEATVRLAIGTAYGEAMLIPQAIEQKRRALGLFERFAGAEDPRSQRARYLLAADLIDDSRFDEARALIDQTDAARARQGQTDLETTLAGHRAACYWFIRRGQYDAGLPACEGAVAVQAAFDPDDDTALAKARANLAVLHSRAGRPDQAELQFEQLAQAFAAQGDDASPTRLRVLYLHGMNLLALGRLDEAAGELTLAHQGAALVLGVDNPHTLEVAMGLAQLHLRRREPARAAALLREAHAAYARKLGPENHYTLDARRQLEQATCEQAGGADAGSPVPACTAGPDATVAGADADARAGGTVIPSQSAAAPR